MTLTDIYYSLNGSGLAVTDTNPGVVSTNWVDLDKDGLGAKRDLGGGRLLVARFVVTVAVTAGGDADNTVEFALVRTPMTLATPTTARTFTFDSTADVNDATETIMKTAHGLTNGTRVTSSGTPPTGFTTGTWFYVVGATTNTFQIAATPGGAAVDLTDAVGTCTLTWYPEIVCTSGAIPFHYLTAGTVIEVPIGPPMRIVSGAARPLHRYLYGMVSGPTDIGAGTFTCDIVDGFAMDGKPFNKPNYSTA